MSLLSPITQYQNYDTYDGGESVYLQTIFKKSQVIHEKSSTYNAKLRYNIHTDAIEYQTSKGAFRLNKAKDIHIRIGKDYFYYCNFKDHRGKKKEGYYVLVDHTDRYRIYKKYHVDITDPLLTNTRVLTAKGVIRRATRYYLEEAQRIIELPLKRKEMLALFNDKTTELKTFIKKKKIRLRKEEDLMHFIAFYNALKANDSYLNQSLISTNN